MYFEDQDIIHLRYDMILPKTISDLTKGNVADYLDTQYTKLHALAKRVDAFYSTLELLYDYGVIADGIVRELDVLKKEKEIAKKGEPIDGPAVSASIAHLYSRLMGMNRIVELNE